MRVYGTPESYRTAYEPTLGENVNLCRIITVAEDFRDVDESDFPEGVKKFDIQRIPETVKLRNDIKTSVGRINDQGFFKYDLFEYAGEIHLWQEPDWEEREMP